MPLGPEVRLRAACTVNGLISLYLASVSSRKGILWLVASTALTFLRARRPLSIARSDNPDYKSVGLRATPVPKRKRAPRRTVNVESTPVYATMPRPEAETDLA